MVVALNSNQVETDVGTIGVERSELVDRDLEIPLVCYLDVSTASFMLVTNVAMYPMNRCSLGSDACLAGLKTRLEDAEESLMDYVMGTWPPTPVDYDQSAKFYEHIKKLICHALDEIREAIGLLN